KIITLDNRKYFSPNNCYQAMWMLTTTILLEVLKDPIINIFFDQPNLHREHAASFSLGLPPHHEYRENVNDPRFLNMIPLLEIDSSGCETSTISSKSLIHHLPNRYLDMNKIS